MSQQWVFAVVAALLASVSAVADTDGFQLVSPREYKSELSARHRPHARFVTRGAELNAPTITVIKPEHSAALQPPVDIQLRFAAAEGATVNVSSLKIMYGFLKLDVTQRILKAPGVEVSADGLKANGAQLPSGNHKLLIQIADSLGRVGQQPLEFTVK